MRKSARAAVTVGLLVIGPFVHGADLDSPNKGGVFSSPARLPPGQHPLGSPNKGGVFSSETTLRRDPSIPLEIVRDVLRNARIGYTGLTVESDVILFTISDPARIDDARQALAKISPPLAVVIGSNGKGSVKVSGGADAPKQDQLSRGDQRNIQIGELNGPWFQQPVMGSLVLLYSDLTTHAEAWAISLNNDICFIQMWKTFIGPRPVKKLYTVLALPSESTVLQQKDATLRLLENAVAAHLQKCPDPTSFENLAFVVSQASVVDAVRKVLQAGEVGIGRTYGGLASLYVDAKRKYGVNEPARGYKNEVASRYQAEMQKEAAERERQQILARQQAAEDAKRAFNEQAARLRTKFAATAGVRTASPDFDELWANPFPSVGKVVHYHTKFLRMQTATEAIFGSAQPFLVKDIPEGILRRPGRVIIAGRVLGNTKLGEGAAAVQVPLLSYTNVYVCSSDSCEEYFGRQ